ncbi:Hypothetical predicted protein [Olea europaea subsp. europaea]|uniref:Uncharacterized protein n=2 Tax=Olea europaea subsp. europaea TaxID=158383 RepID=A0A8S0R5Z4_OLEEU|nr:Hypothetical predicted protein [Olea europaea subsp. europaea]
MRWDRRTICSSTYINMEKLSAGGGSEINDYVFNDVGSGSGGSGGGVSVDEDKENSSGGVAKSRYSMDSSSLAFSEIVGGGGFLGGMMPMVVFAVY